MTLTIPRNARFNFGGPMGERVAANVDNWLLRAPLANPGILEMMRVRDRQPVPDIMPWAGEFIGKYLMSAVQACRMTDDPRLKPFVAEVITELISTQAEDGYLGPFRKEERLLAHWDLWGHYHAMTALLMWYEDTGDRAALDCAIRVADLVCNTFLDTDKRVWDAGSHEMNMSIMTSLGHLYRALTEGHGSRALDDAHTRDSEKAERYLRMMGEIVKDWERPPAGDYLRSALNGLDFYRTPKPRWESLACLQGLLELHRITGDQGYARAFWQHWVSIRNYDRHPSGGFTTGEQAIGNPYTDGAIETCCTTAWMALCVDMLRLSGWPAAADELELATWNSMLGSQHPSGRWWTYNTPVDGVREASAHTIVFQSRFGTPELNCCSVNAPRGLGMLSEWAVMVAKKRLAISYYGPCEAEFQLPDGTDVRLKQETKYPVDGKVRITIGLDKPKWLTVQLRVPPWTREMRTSVNGELRSHSAGLACDQPAAGARRDSLDTIYREWSDGDVIELDIDMTLHHWSGELSKQGKAALYRGPLLLAYDQKYNDFDADNIPTLDLANLQAEPVTTDARFQPLVLLKFRGTDGRDLTLCDFATAGMHGTHYRAWLPAVNGLPAPFYMKQPTWTPQIPPCPVLFEWTGYRSSAATGRTFTLEITEDEAPQKVVLAQTGITGTRFIVREGLEPNKAYSWRVTAVNEHGPTLGDGGNHRFWINPTMPNTLGPEAEEAKRGPGELIVASPLDGNGDPGYGTLEAATAVAPAADRLGNEGKAVAFDGQTSRLVYAVPEFPLEDYTAAAWVCPEGLPTDRNQQVVCAWAAGLDDPLRIVIIGEEVFARIEAGGMVGTPGVKLTNGRWTHVAAVKREAALELYVDGELKGTCVAPFSVYSSAHNIAVGTNPNYSGNECLVGKVDDFAFWGRALTAEEVGKVFREGKL